MRRLVLVLLTLLCVTACTSAASDAPPDASDRACGSVHFDDVRGPVPSYVDPPLARFDADLAMCEGLWLPFVDDLFVPQGLALDGRTAWVSGYRWHPTYGDRPCRLVQVSLRTGRPLATTGRLVGAVGERRPTFCRHGGALVLDRHGLWLAEADRLWLVDPARVGHRDAVLRVWRTERPVRGSAMLADRSTLSLTSFSDRGPGRTRVFALDDLLAPGATTLVPGRATSAGQVAPVRTAPAIRRVQGVTAGPGGVWSTSSVSTCGMLVLPSGRRVAFAPGAEDLELDGRGGLWAVLESGARIYQRDGRPLVPMLARFDVRTLLDGPAESCSW